MFRKIQTFEEACQEHSSYNSQLRRNRRLEILEKRRQEKQETYVITTQTIHQISNDLQLHLQPEEILKQLQRINTFLSSNEHRNQLNHHDILNKIIELFTLHKENKQIIKECLITINHFVEDDTNMFDKSILRKYQIHLVLINILNSEKDESTINMIIDTIGSLVYEDIQMRDEVLNANIIKVILKKQMKSKNIAYLFGIFLQTKPGISYIFIYQMVPLIKQMICFDKGLFCIVCLLKLDNQGIDAAICPALESIIGYSKQSLRHLNCIGYIFSSDHVTLFDRFIERALDILFHYSMMINSTMKKTESNIQFNCQNEVIQNYLWLLGNIIIGISMQTNQASQKYIDYIFDKRLVQIVVNAIFHHSRSIVFEALNTLFSVLSMFKEIPKFIQMITSYDYFFDIFNVLFINISEEYLLAICEIVLILVTTINIDIINRLRECNIFGILQQLSLNGSCPMNVSQLIDQILRIEKLFDMSNENFEL